MLKLLNLKRPSKKIELNGVEYEIKKYTVGVEQSLFMERYENCKFERDPETGKTISIEGKINNGVDLIGREIFGGLASWGLIEEKGEALPLTEKNCIEFATHYPVDAGKLLEEIREFNGTTETEEENAAKKN